MSDKSKIGDTSSSSLSSSSSASISSRIVKNPLLSASVTGLTFDDFQHKPLLLPAAPPIITTAPIVQESKSIVSDVDSDTFSEINLNAPLDEDISQSGDLLNNSIQEGTTTSDESILSQAASSFSQLPTVASSVFSTFSKVIKDYSPTNTSNTRENSSEKEVPQLDTVPSIQSTTSAFVPVYPESTFENQSIPEPPKFYSPSEIPHAPTSHTSIVPPLTSSQQTNTYRLSAKKKTYAQIPGITTSSSLPSSSSSPGFQNQQPSHQFPPTSFAVSTHQQQKDISSSSNQEFSQKPEERKGLFSFANLVPPVLQNLSGLVQSSSKQAENNSVQNETIAPDLRPINPFADNQIQESSIPVVPQFYNPSNVAKIISPSPSLFGLNPTEKQVEPPIQAQFFSSGIPNPSSIISTTSTDTKADNSVTNFFSNTASNQQQQQQNFPVPPPSAFGTNSIASSTVQVPSSSPQFFSPQSTSQADNSNIVSPPSSSTQQPITSQAQPPLARPPTNIGSNTFRLQKGTRLYKSPFTSSNAVYAPLTSALDTIPGVPQNNNDSPALFQLQEPSQSTSLPPPPAIFNPFQQQDSGVSQPTQISSLDTTSKNNNVLSGLFQPQESTQSTSLPPPPAIFNHFQQQDSGVSQPTQISSVDTTSKNNNVLSGLFQPQESTQSTSLPPPPPKIFNPLQQQDSGVGQAAQTTSTDPHNKTVSPKVFEPQKLTQPSSLPPPPTIFNPFQQQNTVVSQPAQIPSQENNFVTLPSSENIVKSTTQSISQNTDNFKNLPPQESGIFKSAEQTPADAELTQPQNINFAIFSTEKSVEKSIENLSPQPPQIFKLAEQKTQDIFVNQQHPPFFASSLQQSEDVQVPPPPIFNPNQQLLQNIETNQQQLSAAFLSDNLSTLEINKSQGQEVLKENKEEVKVSQSPNTTSEIVFSADKNLSKEQPLSVSNIPLFSSEKETEKFKKETKQETSQTSRTQQHINPFDLKNLAAPISQSNPAVSSSSVVSFNTDTNQNPLSLHSADHFDKSNTTTGISQTENINNNNVPTTLTNENQPQIFNLSNYFSNQANNNFQQSQLFSTTSVSSAPLPTSTPTPPISVTESTASGLSNYFSANLQAPVSNQSTIEKEKQVQQQQHEQQQHQQNQQQQQQQQTIGNILFTPQNFQAPPPQLPDPSSFFDSFEHNSIIQSTTTTTTENSFNSIFNSTSNEDPNNSLQIQNFFNNPPQNISDSVSELNYKLVTGSRIINKRIENQIIGNNNDELRTISPLSNIVEPPSSSCSEFSSDFSSQQQQQQQQQQQKQQSQVQLLPEHLSKLSSDELPDEIIEQLKMSSLSEDSSSKSSVNVAYRPVTKHWFYNKNSNKKPNWMPFSQSDSDALEECYLNRNGEGIVAVEGGRYDVNIKERTRIAVYWVTEPTEVRRCSWFYKSVDSKYVPYEEDVAEKLEEEYKQASISGEWRRKVSLPSGENVTFHGPNVMVHFHHPLTVDAWGGSSTTPARPRVVKRDIDDFNIEPGESSKVDHLLLMVHGIGSACDLRFRSLEEVDYGIYVEVDEFRSIATQLIQSHYKTSCDNGDVKRVEVLPVSWHSELHSKESGIDERLKAITLESIPKLRNFTNDTLVDVLFYTSPVFCQNIISTVGTAMNSIYIKYCQRNPDFKGGVSLAGHSLGSLILFDLLCHQNPVDNVELQNSENPDHVMQKVQSFRQSSHTEQISYTVGPAGTGQPFISYPQLIFQPKKFFALGSPIGMFVTIRGIDTLGLDFKFPTCQGFYNIFHPYDPVAYRLEALINPSLSTVRPVLIPHHKGRKRMHLELKETMTRVSADLKQKIVGTFKNTVDSVYYLTSRNKQSDSQEIQKEVNKVIDEHLKAGATTSPTTGVETNIRSRSTSTSSDADFSEIDLPLGKLNNSKRIDYVLQEAPLEFFNEYLFALTSHVCYWDSEDTILFIMKEIYSQFGFSPDSQIPQQTMTIERPSSRKGSSNSPDDATNYNNK